MKNLETIQTWLAAQRGRMIDLQKKLAACQALAPESGGDGEFEKCLLLEKELAALGLPSGERFDAPDSRVSAGFRPNLVVTIPGRRSEAVWIMTHLDVVPPGDLSKWDSNPWTVVEKDGKLFGRGVEDNQQGLVSSVFAALAFVENGIVPDYTIKLLFVADEEVGSTYGIRFLLEHHRLFGAEDLILIPDGGDPAGDAMEIAEKNILWLRITTRGVQTHASRPDQGVNAHLAGCALALELNALEQHFNARDTLFEPDRSTIQPTRKEANVPNVNTIPGEDVFYLDCRILPRYSLADVLDEISRTAKRIEERYRVSISWRIDQQIESKATPKDAPVVLALARAIELVYGATARPIGVGGGTVAAELRNNGYNAVVWSRMDETAHQPNEYCVLDYLCGDAAVMAALMLGEASE
ncbi:MAG TPA: M20 family metallo-hydrolase [Treponemataceae bacterium]|jgi:succinyl-diaminopimelate desuccinylase|nr:MAG: Succinyl-diaminopimelate desuccinylase [Spirochaetes bacterium ADurb.Bin215]HOF84869.1 M20 family metallo-hydrolase [Treponemataceae bacterium]HOS34528.1 M20 family metallo-hydrolase [Treponemataceae bacterium]HOU38462.1 M20 family metallo-hydrolase [Treponemataceae bacterium]HPA09777.1 M20 family metallo-hydrolase [Treponemataceae bacterium]